jgi:hypothetical protein
MLQAEPYRAGRCYRQPDTSRAEMFQVRFTHPLSDLYGLLSAPQAASTSTVPRRPMSRLDSTGCGGQVSERVRGAGAGLGGAVASGPLRSSGKWQAAT